MQEGKADWSFPVLVECEVFAGVAGVHVRTGRKLSLRISHKAVMRLYKLGFVGHMVTWLAEISQMTS